MSRISKKTTSVLVVLCLIMSLLLAACSNNEPIASPVPDDNATEAPKETAAAQDKVHEYSWLSIYAPLEDGSWGQKYIEETFNMKMKIVRVDDDKYQEQLNL